MRCIVTDRNRHVLIDKPIDEKRGLYFVDVQHFLDVVGNDHVVNSVAVTHRHGPVTPVMLAAVRSLHNRLHHAASPAVMARALRFGAWPEVELLPTTVERVYAHQDCLACLLGKVNRLPHSGAADNIPPQVFGECAALDFKPVTPVSVSGHIGFYMFSERSRRFLFAVLTKVHDSVCELEAIRIYHSYLKKYGHTLTSLIVDAGTVEKDRDLILQLGEMGIVMLPVPPESQFANPEERSVQTVVKGVGAMFADQEYIGNTVWNLAVLEFLGACNVCPNVVSGQYSPWFYLTGKHPLILKRFKFRFGQPVVSVILQQQKSKFSFAPHGEFGFAVGGADNNSTLLYIPSRSRHRVYWRRDVRPVHFAESHAAAADKTKFPQPVLNDDGSITIPEFPRQSDRVFDLCTDMGKIPLADHGEDFYMIRDIVSSGDLSDPPASLKRVRDDTTSIPDENDLDSDDEPIAKRLRSEPPVIQSVWYEDPSHEWYCPQDQGHSLPPCFRESYINATMAKSAVDFDNPTLKQAKEGDEWVHVWKPACDKEMQTLADFKTGTEVKFADIPPDATIYPSKFVLKKKRDTVGWFLSAKARLVVCANWIAGVFQSLFAPTVNEKSMKLLFAIAVIFGLFITGIDVKGAFLYPEQTRPVYISLPARWTDGTPTYWLLNKTLYGLPESPQAFYRDVSQFLLDQGYSRTVADPCMFYKRGPNGRFICMVVHVDDFAIASSHQELTDEVLAILKSRYTITISDSLESYIGIHIEYLPNGNVRFSQPARIEELLKEYELENVKAPSVPMRSSFNDKEQDDSPQCDHTKYLSLLGKLIFIVKTRPDIAYAVNRLATRAQYATDKDFMCLLRIVSYLGGTKSLGITFRQDNSADAAAAIRLFCYVDASYASHPDSKSHTGYCFGLGDPNNGMFFSRTVKQPNVTLSSTEAENAAAVEATKEIIWFRQLLTELGFPQLAPTLMYCDNASMITLAEDYSGNHKRVKHYLTRVNFMIEQVRMGNIELQHVVSEHNVADILTKPLGPTEFLRLRPFLLGEY
jgi:hypothetical protein